MKRNQRTVEERRELIGLLNQIAGVARILAKKDPKYSNIVAVSQRLSELESAGLPEEAVIFTLMCEGYITREQMKQVLAIPSKRR